MGNTDTPGVAGQGVSPAKYIGQTELGAPGATSGGSDEDFAKGTLDMHMDGPWALSSLEAVSKAHASQWASFPIPSENGPDPAPAFAGGSDLGVWAKGPNKTAAWDLVQVMDSPTNAYPPVRGRARDLPGGSRPPRPLPPPERT